jgi:hypothetical protein
MPATISHSFSNEDKVRLEKEILLFFENRSKRKKGNYFMAFANLSVTTARKLKKLLFVGAETMTFEPNFVSLASKLQVSLFSLEEYLTFMEHSGIIARLHDSVTGIVGLGKVEKVYLDNPYLIYFLSAKAPQTGNIRETFFMNRTRVNNAVISSAVAGFKIDKSYPYHYDDRISVAGSVYLDDIASAD